MSESHFRGVVVALLASLSLDPISVENPVYPGTPDVNYVGGWLELKVLKAWPVRATTPVRISTFTQQQRVWLARRWKRQGQAHLLIRVKREWVLIRGCDAPLIGSLPKSELLSIAVGAWNGQPDPTNFLAALQKRSGL